MENMIIGRGIDLKPIEESDIEQLREWRNSKEVSDYMLTREIISKEQQEFWYASITKSKNELYWIIQTKKGKQVGMACLTKIKLHEFNAEPGLYIGNKEDRSSLFGMEAYYLLLDYGFKNLGLEIMYGTVLESNIAAIKMNNMFGYKTEKVIPDHFEFNDFFYSVKKIILHKEEFYKSKILLFLTSRK